MKPYFILVLVALLFTLSCRREVPVDTIFYNGKIFTARTPSEFVEAMAVKDGVIVAVGTTEEMFDAYLPADTTGVDLKNRLVLPGFHDAHLHVWNGAKLQRELDLRGLTSLEAVLQKVREAVAQAPPGEWIIGRGWDHELWATRKLPDRKLLDAISRKHPIYLKRVDGHAAWVNSVVLRLLRYTEHTEDPEGGKIMRYPGTRIPNGILFDAAFELLDKIVPEPTFTQKYELVKSIIEKANRLGVTAVTDNSPLDLYPVYVELQKNQALTWRVNFFISYTENLDSVKAFIARQGEIPHHLQARLMKLYADGSLGSRTAYLKQPYTDAPESVGIPRYSPEALTEMVRRADSAGFQIGIHGIGDAGVAMILDTYQEIREEAPRPDRRWRIEHAQVVDSVDFRRFRKLGVIASMQPSHCITDLHWAEQRLGKRRARYAYAWRTFLDQGVPLAFGTDWPVEPLNPMVGLYAAITRQDTLGFPEGGWFPEERISLGEAIMAYTHGSAYAARMERWCGTLTPGKVADFVIMDRNLFQASPEEILHARVLATYFNGKQVYSAE